MPLYTQEFLRAPEFFDNMPLCRRAICLMRLMPPPCRHAAICHAAEAYAGQAQEIQWHVSPMFMPPRDAPTLMMLMPLIASRHAAAMRDDSAI